MADNDSMVQDYAELSQARDEASSPTAQLIKRRNELRLKNGSVGMVLQEQARQQPEMVLPQPGIVAPGAEPDARGVPAAPGEAPAGGMGHVPSQGKDIPLPPAGTMPGDRVEPSRGILPSLGEIVKQPVGGLLDTLKNLLRIPQELAAAFQNFNAEMLQTLAETKGEVPADIQQKLDELKRDTTQDADARAAAVLSKVAGKLPEVSEPESVGGSLIRGLSAFLAPFAAARKVTKGLPVIEGLMKSSGSLKRLAGEAAAGGLAGIPADIAAFDPESPRMSNFIEQLHPSLKNPVTEFLKAPELAEGEELALEQRFKERLKNAAEGLALGGALDVLVTSVVAARRVLRVKAGARRFEQSMATARGEQRAGEREAVEMAPGAAPATVEEAAGPLAHDRRKVTMPAATERRGVGVVKPDQVIADVETGMAGMPADTIEAEINRRLGVPPPLPMARRLDATADAVYELHRASGGATFNLKHGDLGGQEAYAVGFAPDLSVPIKGNPTRDDIRAFIENVSKFVDLDNPNISIGTWFDKETGETALDLVATPRDQETAIRWGKAFNQKAVFDLKNFVEIPTGGTGLDPGSLPPLLDRLRVIYGNNGPRTFPQSVREITEKNGEAARQGLAKIVMKWLRDETGAITFGKGGLEKDELQQLGLIGAAALARGQKSKAAFQDAIESAFSVGGRLRFNADDVLRIRAESEKVYARNVKTALRRAQELSKELGDENTYHGLPNTGRLLRLFNDGKFALGWYDQANTELRRWFGKDADLMADLIAATSPRTNPDRNVYEAVETYIALRQGKAIDEIEGIFAGPAAKIKRDLVQQVLDGRPIDTPKAGAFAKNIKGDPNAVTVDVWMTRAFYGGDIPRPGMPARAHNIGRAQSEFLQEWVRQLAYSTGVAPREMQAAIWTGIRMEKEFLFEGAAEFAPLREIIGKQAKQAFEEGRLFVPEELRNDAGFTRVGMLWFTSRVAAGALFGASGENRSMDDRIAGAIYGAGVASVLSPSAAAKLVRKMSDVLTSEKVTQAPRRAGRSSAALGIATEPVKPEAHSFSSLADEFAARVKEATRGEVLDEETGFVKVRPRATQFAEAEVVRQQMSPEAIQQLMPTIRMNDAEAIAMAQVMNEAGLRLRALAVTAKQGGFKDADVQEVLKELYVMGRMDPKRLGALAEAGRTLGALNDPVSGMNQFLNQFTEVLKNANTTVTPQRMIDAIASFKTPEELAVFARQLTKPGLKDYFFEVWINGLLSGPKTLLVNGLGNASFLLYNVGERGLAAGIRSEGGVAPGEAKAMLGGIIEAHGDALRAFWKLVKDADEIPDASKLDAPRKAITAENLNLTGTPGRAVDFLGSAIRTPGRVLAGTDEYFKAIATRAQLRALAKREAFNEVERLGLTGVAAVSKMNEIERAFLLDPPASAMQQARGFAEYVTFTQSLGETGQALQQLQKTAIGRVVIPFVRTPINLAKAGLERSGPLGLASQRLRAELNSTDPAVRDLARAKLALSSMTLSLIGVMAANGYVTGGGPQDPVLRKQWLAAGYQPYSFDVGAMLGRQGPPKPGDLVAFSRLDPIAMPFGMMADVVTIMGHLPPDEQEEFATAMVVGFSKNFTSKTFVQGVAQATSLMADPERYGGSYVKNLLTSGSIPFSAAVRQAATALDPELKDAQGIIEEYKRRIPGLSTEVPADLDLFGNPRFLGGGLGRDLVPETFVPAVDFVMPIYVNSASKEHQGIFATLNENSIRTAEAPASIDGVKLSNFERAELKRIASKEIAPDGMTMPQALKKLFASPAFKAAAPGRGEGREALVNIVIRGYYKGAIEVLQDRFPDLKRDVRNARVKRLRSMGANPKDIERIRTMIGVD